MTQQSNEETMKLVQEILEQKFELEKLRFKPRVILINEKLYDMILGEWLESYKQLPWGDTAAYELQRQMEKNRNVFLGDATLFGLWVIKVDSIENFEVR
ncbi:MAG: hypothetical protein WC516_07140 [Patescibacteria group bacterium]|jgi:hypothetical protein